ncbi:hypothetical protein JOB18_039650 [Solea senegalensis]|uniref:Uncharacterized protein n=1 Tax=Solea senegalensis TaxID=28829 RepID=A0AAV6RHU6_SOLSE|nr:hypothetical protein JOB18_039650 [Solea senegalensis]
MERQRVGEWVDTHFMAGLEVRSLSSADTHVVAPSAVCSEKLLNSHNLPLYTMVCISRQQRVF